LLAEARYAYEASSPPPVTPELQSIPEGAGKEGAAKEAADKVAEEERRRQEQLANQNQQRILAAADLRNQLNQISFEQAKTLNEEELDHAKRMIDLEFDYREARANQFDKIRLGLVRKLAQQEQKIIESIAAYETTVLEAQAKNAAAQVKATAAAQADAIKPAPVAPTTGGSGVTGGLTGGGQSDASRGTSTGPHLHAQLVRAMRGASLEAMVDAALDFGGGMTATQMSVKYGGALGRGAGPRGPHGHGYPARDYYTPQGSPFALRPGWTASDMGIQGALGRGMQVSGPMGVFELGHLAGVKTGGAAGAPVSSPAFSVEKRGESAKQDLQTTQAQSAASVKIVTQKSINELLQADIETRNAIAAAMEASFPIEQQKLDNQLDEFRIGLQLQGLSDERIDLLVRQKQAEMAAIALTAALTESQKRLNTRIAEQKKLLDEGKKSPEEYARAVEPLDNQVKVLDQDLTKVNSNLLAYNTALEGSVAASESAKSALALATAIRDTRKALDNLQDPALQMISIAQGIGEAFGEAFRGMITGASSVRETLATFFQNIGNMFADMVTRFITESIRLKIMETAEKMMGLVGQVGSSIAGAGSSAMSVGAGEYSNSVMPNFGGVGAAAPATSGPIPLEVIPFTGFATGGIVKGPTMGLVGEGRYNEAVVPLPDGKSIPVELGNGGSNQVVSNITVNITDGKMQSDSNGSNSSEFGKRLEGAVKQVITQEMRPGGVLAGKR
jgi:hypothetical protein